MWKKTFALALELPFDADEITIWTKIVKRHPKYTEFFITASTTIDIIKLPYIGYSLSKWFKNNLESLTDELIKNFSVVLLEYVKEFRRRVIREYASSTSEDKAIFSENYLKYKEKIKAMEIEHDSIRQSYEFFVKLDKEMEEIDLKEEENDLE